MSRFTFEKVVVNYCVDKKWKTEYNRGRWLKG